MKQNKRVSCALLCIVCILSICVIGNANNNNEYTVEATIIKADNNLISAIDNTGNVWCYEVEDNTMPRVDTKVVLTMATMNTEMIYDDQVVDVR